MVLNYLFLYTRGNEEQTASKKGKLGHMFAENVTL